MRPRGRSACAPDPVWYKVPVMLDKAWQGMGAAVACSDPRGTSEPAAQMTRPTDLGGDVEVLLPAQDLAAGHDGLVGVEGRVAHQALQDANHTN